MSSLSLSLSLPPPRPPPSLSIYLSLYLSFSLARSLARFLAPSLLCTLSMEKWDKEKKLWFTGGNVPAYKAGSFNMCLRHMGFRPTKAARYFLGGVGVVSAHMCMHTPPPPPSPHFHVHICMHWIIWYPRRRQGAINTFYLHL